MDQTARRTCPACGGDKYLFRDRKKIPAENGQAEAMDTKYRFKTCEHIWTE
jgi:DNA-directed RNA polymerase subunit M/transcription elongation factor TFIIS